MVNYIDVEDATEFPKQLEISIKENRYTRVQIYNCDETASYYRMLPVKPFMTGVGHSVLFCFHCVNISRRMKSTTKSFDASLGHLLNP